MMSRLDEAENAARLLSLNNYQGYSCWGVEMSYQKAFEHGQVYEQTEKLDVVAVQHGISHVRLTEAAAFAAVASLEQQQPSS